MPRTTPASVRTVPRQVVVVYFLMHVFLNSYVHAFILTSFIS
jgi:hypothetical protein